MSLFCWGRSTRSTLKIPFTDIDITTSATPEQVLEVVPDANKEYGPWCYQFQIWWYDCELLLSELKHILTLETIASSLFNQTREDLDRRDFTINALAMSPNGKIYDLVKESKTKNKSLELLEKARFALKRSRILRAFTLVLN